MSRIARIIGLLGATLVFACPAHAGPFESASAFWASVHPEDPPQCKVSQIIWYEDKDSGEADRKLVRYGWVPRFGAKSCEIHLNYYIIALPYERQCIIIAHEMGHDWYGYQHSEDISNVMFPRVDKVPPPGGCYAPSSQSARQARKQVRSRR